MSRNNRKTHRTKESMADLPSEDSLLGLIFPIKSSGRDFDAPNYDTTE